MTERDLQRKKGITSRFVFADEKKFTNDFLSENNDIDKINSLCFTKQSCKRGRTVQYLEHYEAIRWLTKSVLRQTVFVT